MSHVEITPELLTELEKMAKTADVPEWECIGKDVVCYGVMECDEPNADSQGDTPEEFLIAQCESEGDAEFIAAANPAVVLAMIERIRFLEATR